MQDENLRIYVSARTRVCVCVRVCTRVHVHACVLVCVRACILGRASMRTSFSRIRLNVKALPDFAAVKFSNNSTKREDLTQILNKSKPESFWASDTQYHADTKTHARTDMRLHISHHSISNAVLVHPEHQWPRVQS